MRPRIVLTAVKRLCCMDLFLDANWKWFASRLRPTRRFASKGVPSLEPRRFRPRIARMAASSFEIIRANREFRGQRDLGFRFARASSCRAQNGNASTEELRRTQKFVLPCRAAWACSFCVLLCLLPMCFVISFARSASGLAPLRHDNSSHVPRSGATGSASADARAI